MNNKIDIKQVINNYTNMLKKESENVEFYLGRGIAVNSHFPYTTPILKF